MNWYSRFVVAGSKQGPGPFTALWFVMFLCFLGWALCYGVPHLPTRPIDVDAQERDEVVKRLLFGISYGLLAWFCALVWLLVAFYFSTANPARLLKHANRAILYYGYQREKYEELRDQAVSTRNIAKEKLDVRENEIRRFLKPAASLHTEEPTQAST